MELRRLRLLHELSRLGTVAAVAQALSYSPSSVSVQLAQLEHEAGAVLVRKVGRKLELTAAGHRLAAHAAQALAADEAVRAELADPDAVVGRLRMTIVQAPALALLPGTLERLHAVAPQLQVEVRQQETAPALHDLHGSAVDLVVGIEYDPVPVPRHRDVDRQDLLREDVVLTLHPDHPAARRTAVDLRELRESPWAAGHRGTGLDAVVRNVCNRVGGFEPDIRHRSDDGLVLTALVGSGRAVALLPYLLTTSLPGLTTRPLEQEHLQRTIFTAVRGSAAQAPAVAAVREALRHTATVVAADRPGVVPAG